MQLKKLGSSDLMVTDICLGTMTWGRQNTEADAHAQIDYALAQGINFIDTAEIYSFPPRAETYGNTEVMIGNWLAQHPERRAEIVLMTKIGGRGMAYLRNGGDIVGDAIGPSIDASLRRLQTDYIDVYQLHWPNRPNPAFGRHGFGKLDFAKVDPQKEEAEIHGVLSALAEAVAAGKIRYCGLSNETPWGIDLYMRLAREYNLPTMVSIQNEFSLLHALDWPFTVEACQLHDIAYLPWSPLAGGVLSGKYLGGDVPEGSRWSMTDRHGNFRNKPAVHAAVAEYAVIAERYGITPSQLALAWCHQFPWVTSTIIGATSMAQLQENIAAFDVSLTDEALAEINAVQQRFAMPF